MANRRLAEVLFTDLGCDLDGEFQSERPVFVVEDEVGDSAEAALADMVEADRRQVADWIEDGDDDFDRRAPRAHTDEERFLAAELVAQ